jgi:hypothetical protein
MDAWVAPGWHIPRMVRVMHQHGNRSLRGMLELNGNGLRSFFSTDLSGMSDLSALPECGRLGVSAAKRLICWGFHGAG